MATPRTREPSSDNVRRSSKTSFALLAFFAFLALADSVVGANVWTSHSNRRGLRHLRSDNAGDVVVAEPETDALEELVVDVEAAFSLDYTELVDESVPNDEHVPQHGDAHIRIEITTDSYPEETSWTLLDTCPGRDGSSAIAVGGSYMNHGTVAQIFRTRKSKWAFEILDAGGDGMCCSHGTGGYKVFVDNVLQISGGDFRFSDLKYFGSCHGGDYTLKPTNLVTASPTNHPTGYPTHMPTTARPTRVPTHNPTSHPTNRPTRLPTSHPTSGPTNRPTRIPTRNPTSNPTSRPTRHPTPHPTSRPTNRPTRIPTSNPTSKPTMQPTGPREATFDPNLGAPVCHFITPICTTLGTGPTGQGSLGSLLAAKTVSGERNGPNTIDHCTDGDEGKYGVEGDSSIEAISVIMESTDPVEGGGIMSSVQNHGVLRAGARARIIAKVYPYLDGQSDRADFYYTTNPARNPGPGRNNDWKYISTATPAQGSGPISVDSGLFTLEDSYLQAVRVVYRWVGETTEATSCPTLSGDGAYSDVDDLAFVVDTEQSQIGTDGGLAFSFQETVAEREEDLNVDCIGLNEDRCTRAQDFCAWKNQGKKKGCHRLK